MKKIIITLLGFLFLLLCTISVNGAIEDFTTYTEIDPDSDITITSDTITVVTMRRDVEAHVTYDKGVNHFGDLTHWVDIKITAIINGGICIFWGVSDISNTLTEMRDANKGICAYIYRSTSDSSYRLYISAPDNSDANDYYICSVDTQYYVWINRSGTTFTCDIFDNALRRGGDKIDALSCVSSSNPYQYMIGCGSFEYDTLPSVSASCIISNLDLKEIENKEPSFGGLYYPSNNSVNLCPCCIIFGVNVSDVEGDAIDIIFSSNYSNSWIIVLTFSDVSNGTYYGVVNNLTNFNWSYYWRVNISGTDGTNSSAIFTFNTTSNISCGGTVSNGISTDEIITYALTFGILGGILGGFICLCKKIKNSDDNDREIRIIKTRKKSKVKRKK